MSPLVAVFLGDRLFTEYLWFEELGDLPVFWGALRLKIALFAGTAGAAAAGFCVTFVAAVRHAPGKVPRDVLFAGAVGCLISAGLVGRDAAGQWQTVMLWLHGSRFGVVDPVHHRDAAFFVFALPLATAIGRLLLTSVVICVLITLAVHTLAGGTSLRPVRATRAFGVQLAVLMSLGLVDGAWLVSLARYGMEVTDAPADAGQSVAIPGADYTDVHVRMPMLLLLAGAMLLCVPCLFIAAAIVGHEHRHPPAHRTDGRSHFPFRFFTAILCAIVAAVLVTPGIVQQFVVDPQPVARERPFLAGAISTTRFAFSLDQLRVTEPPRRTLAGRSVSRIAGGLGTIQLWDGSVAVGNMNGLGSVTPYFRAFTPSLQVHDRNDVPESSVLAEGELDLRRAQNRGQGWLSDHFAYTHGYGIQAYSASQVGRDGNPVPYASPLRQPRIYFGRPPEGPNRWVVANTRRPEVDGHSGVPQRPARAYHYDGAGGVALSSLVRRAAFAIRLHDVELLLSRDITSRSRLIMRGDVPSRLRAVAGFVQWDPDPTTVVANGRIVFLVAGYTTSTHFPQAQAVPLAGSVVNYARASVWATVDAFSGQTRLYLVDGPDPIARAWAATFPTLFRPMTDLPRALRPQLRYPPALFDAQATLFEQYHSVDPNAFATGSDSWARPTSLSGPIDVAGDIRFRAPQPDPRNALRPGYRLAEPGRDPWNPLARTTLYAPLSGQNVIGQLNGMTDPLGHLQLSLIVLRRSGPTLGPSQITRLMILDPSASQLLASANRETRDLGKDSLAEVVLGTPRWQLLDGVTCQVQAIYLQASASGVARLLGVTVYLGGRIGIGSTVAEAAVRALAPQ